MNDLSKIRASHLNRAAYVYLRQSTAAQVEHNRESTQRQYALAARATALGWSAQQIVVIDEDLGLSGSGIVERSGFGRLTAEVALGHIGIVLGLEVSRLARNNADWYRLLDLCGLTDTLIGDADGIYHSAMFNDRLLLGLKGTMSEAELHVLRARLLGGIRNKAARASCAAGFPWASYGVNRMVRYASIRMKPCARRSVPCLRGSPSSDRCAASGCGCAPRACHSRCRPATAAACAGSTPATSPPIMC
jgi:DNA invertase Pin-like site-specific DNA recombinase